MIRLRQRKPATARPVPEPEALRQALRQGRFEQVIYGAAALLKTRPMFAEAHFLFAMGLEGAGRLSMAVHAASQAVALELSGEYLTQLARLLLLTRQERAARAVVERAIAAGLKDALSLDTAGCVLAHLGDHAAAVPLFERAVAGEPQNSGYRFNLASALGFLGRYEEARQQYEAILAANPAETRAHLALSSAVTARPDANNLARLQGQLASTQDPVGRLHLQYALAKEYEDLGQHDRAFAHLHEANSRRKAELGYNIATDEALFERLIERFSAPGYFQGTSALEDAPIFVLGLPRTGTTLVDRILSSHPDVWAAGELQAMPLAVKLAAGTQTPFTLDPATIDAAAHVYPEAVGRDYLDRAAVYRRGNAPRFTDKLPLNFLYIGYIARALPQAKIICLRRNPMDSVWSNYKNLFATGFSYYNYSYDLLDTARYYVLFDRLMAFWDRLFPGRVLQVQYEDLVDDQEAQTRRLLAHAGLSWHDACLRFHENRAAVSTPSATQVRRPLYRDAVGRWRSYAEAMKPVAEYFRSQGIVVDEVET